MTEPGQVEGGARKEKSSKLTNTWKSRMLAWAELSAVRGRGRPPRVVSVTASAGAAVCWLCCGPGVRVPVLWGAWN